MVPKVWSIRGRPVLSARILVGEPDQWLLKYRNGSTSTVAINVSGDDAEGSEIEREDLIGSDAKARVGLLCPPYALTSSVLKQPILPDTRGLVGEGDLVGRPVCS
jgi:hypothetical protein